MSDERRSHAAKAVASANGLGSWTVLDPRPVKLPTAVLGELNTALGIVVQHGSRRLGAHGGADRHVLVYMGLAGHVISALGYGLCDRDEAQAVIDVDEPAIPRSFEHVEIDAGIVGACVLALDACLADLWHHPVSIWHDGAEGFDNEAATRIVAALGLVDIHAPGLADAARAERGN